MNKIPATHKRNYNVYTAIHSELNRGFLREMKTTLFFIINLIIILIVFGCDNSTEVTEPEPFPWDSSNVRKPNLYIYPEQELNLAIKIAFPNGGKITESIPEYAEGWNVNVKPSGIIDDTYEYLFYECTVPDLHQKKYGWTVPKNNLNEFFTKNLSASNFSEKEINDFIEYWTPLLDKYDYYKIYPQYIGTIEKMSIINFSVEPKNIFRLHYYVQGTNKNNNNLLMPTIQTAVREEFFAVEWGVILE